MACGPHYFMVNRRGKVKVVTDFLLGSRITAPVTAAMKSEDDCFLAGKLTNLDNVFKLEVSLCYKSPYSQSYGFSNSHVWM